MYTTINFPNLEDMSASKVQRSCAEVAALLSIDRYEQARLALADGYRELAALKETSVTASDVEELEKALLSQREIYKSQVIAATGRDPFVLLVLRGVQSFLVSPEGQFLQELSHRENITIGFQYDGIVGIRGTAWSAELFPDFPVLNAGPKLGNESVKIDQNAYIGIVLHESSADECATFENLLNKYGNFCRRASDSSSGVTEIVSTSVLDENGNKTWDAYATSAISRGTESVAGFIQSGADWSGSVFRRAGSLLRSHIEPATVDASIHPRTKAVMKNVEGLAKATFEGVSFVVQGVVGLADSAVQRVTPIISSYLDRKEKTSSTAQKWVGVIKAGGLGAITVLQSMEQAAEALLFAILISCNITTSHKYGKEAHDVARKSLNTVGHVAKSYRLAGHLRYKALIRHSAKKTVQQVVVDLHKEYDLLDESGNVVVADIDATNIPTMCQEDDGEPSPSGIIEQEPESTSQDVPNCNQSTHVD
eukprot:gene8966-1300_t